MTFDIKKFLKDTKAGPYGMIQESYNLEEAVGNFEIKKLARELYSVIKKVNGITSVKITTSDIRNAASKFSAAAKKGNTFADDAVMADVTVNEKDSFLSILLTGAAKFLNPVANEANKAVQAFISQNYKDKLSSRYLKAPNDNTALQIDIKFAPTAAPVKEADQSPFGKSDLSTALPKGSKIGPIVHPDDLMPVGGGNTFSGYSNSLTEDETYLGPKKPEPNKIYNSPQGDEEYAEDNAWMQDIDAEQVGEFIVTYEHPGIITWNKQGAEEDMFFAATPKWDGQPGTPIEAIFAEGYPDTEMIYVEKQDEFVSFQEYAETIYPIIKKYLESKRKDIHGEMFEEEGMDDPDIEDQDDRIMDLGGDNIEQGIISLIDDGFDAQDIMDLCNKIIRNAKHEKKAEFNSANRERF
jgi:hypothetical protein